MKLKFKQSDLQLLPSKSAESCIRPLPLSSVI